MDTGAAVTATLQCLGGVLWFAAAILNLRRSRAVRARGEQHPQSRFGVRVWTVIMLLAGALFLVSGVLQFARAGG